MTDIQDRDNKDWNFIESFNTLALEAHQTALSKGWWDNPRNNGEIIALMHEELSECLNYIRKDPEEKDKHVPTYRGVEVELADLLIRVMDFAHARNYDVAEALIAKLAYNKGREFKHGKKF